MKMHIACDVLYLMNEIDLRIKLGDPFLHARTVTTTTTYEANPIDA